jgi:predicted dehydrogenase
MKALFVGLGSIGQRHLRNLKCLERQDLQLSAFRARGGPGVLNDRGELNPDADPAEYYDMTTFASLEAALADRPDITFVTNPTALHVEVATAAAKAGSHVVIEKPLSHSLSGLDELQSAVTAAGVVAAVAYQFRFHPALLAVKSWLDEGRIGRVVSAQMTNGEHMPGWHAYEDYRETYASRRDLGGGAIATQSHELDMAVCLFGAPRSVYASGGHLSDLEIDVEDVASLSLGCGGDERPFPVSIHLDYLRKPPMKQFVIVGTRGTVRCDFLACSAQLTDTGSGESITEAWPEFQRNDMYLAFLRAFLAAITGKGSAVVSIPDAIASVRAIDAAHKSMAEHRVVQL